MNKPRFFRKFLAFCLAAQFLDACSQSADCPFLGQNLIVNGDFEQGYFGFTSDFGRGLNNGTNGNCSTQGWITVTQVEPHVSWMCQGYPQNLSALYGGPNTETDADPNHPSNTSVVGLGDCTLPLPDHTTGSGFCLNIDPDDVPDRAYWKQNIPIFPNTDYVFSAWVFNLSGQPTPRFHFEVGGKPINPPTSYPDRAWVQTAVLWNSGSIEGTVKIGLVNDQPGCEANDVAIDDLFFGACGAGKCLDKTFVPNIFTPNGDGLNDDFGPFWPMKNLTGFQFRVFDRWGSLVFETDEPALKWNGEFRGKLCETGVFTWLLSVETQFCDKKTVIGSVALVR